MSIFELYHNNFGLVQFCDEPIALIVENQLVKSKQTKNFQTLNPSLHCKRFFSIVIAEICTDLIQPYCFTVATVAICNSCNCQQYYYSLNVSKLQAYACRIPIGQQEIYNQTGSMFTFFQLVAPSTAILSANCCSISSKLLAVSTCKLQQSYL